MFEDWRKTTLGKLLIRRKDFTPVEVGKSYPCAGVLRSGWGLTRRDPFVGGVTKFSKLMQLERNNFVYRTITAFEAPAAVVPEEFDGFFVSPQTFPVYQISCSAILPAYLELITTFPAFHKEMADRCTGSVLRRKTLAPTALESIPINLPPLREQRRIIHLVGALDEAVSAAREAQESLELAQSGLFESLWSNSPLESLSSLGRLVTGATPSTRDESFWSTADVPFVTPGDLAWGGAEVRAVARYTSSNAFAQSSRASDGFTVLQVCIGATAGKVGLLVGRGLFNQQINAVMGLSLKDATVLGALLASRTFQAAFKRIAGSSTMPLVSKSAWAQMEVAWPDPKQRDQWYGLIRDASETTYRQKVNSNGLAALRANLLTALLSGEHEIPQSYDDLMEA